MDFIKSLKALTNAHFPGCSVDKTIQKTRSQRGALEYWLSKRNLDCAKNNFKPFKSSDHDRNFPAQLTKAGGNRRLSTFLVQSFEMVSCRMRGFARKPKAGKPSNCSTVGDLGSPDDNTPFPSPLSSRQWTGSLASNFIWPIIQIICRAHNTHIRGSDQRSQPSHFHKILPCSITDAQTGLGVKRIVHLTWEVVLVNRYDEAIPEGSSIYSFLNVAVNNIPRPFGGSECKVIGCAAWENKNRFAFKDNPSMTELVLFTRMYKIS